MVRKSTAIHKNNKYKIFKPNSLFFNNKNIRNACPKLPALTVFGVQFNVLKFKIKGENAKIIFILNPSK
jgi:hypothetical protein